jgi:hypothetical protein
MNLDQAAPDPTRQTDGNEINVHGESHRRQNEADQRDQP